MLDIEYLYPRDVYREVKKPEVLAEMIDIAYKLSEGFPFVRVDLYNTSDNKIIFGELTFFPEGGTASFSPQSWNEKIGGKIVLPKKQNAWDLVNKVQ